MGNEYTEDRDLPEELFCPAAPKPEEETADTDHKTDGYWKDAWRRFCRNKGSVTAAVIILAILLFSLLTPALITDYDATFMDVNYAKKPPRNLLLRDTFGIADGSTTREFSEKSLLLAMAVGIGAEDPEGTGTVTLEQAMSSEYQPIRKVLSNYEAEGAGGKTARTYYRGRIDPYLEVGFQYRSISREEYGEILRWQEENGLQVLYPLVERNSYNLDPANANNWYKTLRGTPIRIGADGREEYLTLSPDLKLEDNYIRNQAGHPVYYEITGGGTAETAQYRVRILYYNYYRFKNGFAPQYLLGTDSQGYDLALRMAGGLRLSLLLALCVSLVNLTLGTVYGAVEGYYGGGTDIVMERIAEILGGIPFVVAATLFQIHLAGKVGAFPSLLFAFVLTGWIGTAARVRTQFYRFKGQEYVTAARTLGAGDGRIIWKHILPNAVGTVITASVLVIPGTISTESTLSYLGIVKLNTPAYTSLGNLLADAAGIWTNYPHLLLFPALVLSLLLICFNLFGNGLRDAFNPSLRGVEV